MICLKKESLLMSFPFRFRKLLESLACQTVILEFLLF
ncbi:hypothetical protein AB205_0215420 [Aquarana catesbeiana]|uniref:Uncharacterized protein n=1 Tax=Aquarana catesbeiana TaxID=8400 RepID=A0A2G9RRU4_AQUCT|nr:hypothetical protein AB205_0215420 [Aquarana catesbeiana]